VDKLKKLRAGLIGYGNMGQKHAKVLSNLADVDFVGIYDKFIENHLSIGSACFVKSLKELIDLKINYAVIAAPTCYHFDIAQQLAFAGIHTLIEKPLCNNYQSCLNLIDLFERNGLIAAVGYIERYNSAIIEAKNNLSLLGKIHKITTSRQSPYPQQVKDVGVIMDLMTHDIDLCYWFLEQRYESINIKNINFTDQHQDVVAQITGILEGGITFNHLASWSCPNKERKIFIYGEKGFFKLNLLTAELTFTEHNVTNKLVNKLKAHPSGINCYSCTYPVQDSLLREHINFKQILLGEKGHIVSLREGAYSLMIAEYILDYANKTTEVVTLN
jgi:UDP-N-acetylglucosamine 3-dehydrogenase